MGACLSSGSIEVSEEEKRLHREAERSLKEVRLSLRDRVPPSLTPLLFSRQRRRWPSRSRCAAHPPPPFGSPPQLTPLQVLLLGSGDSGKSTILKQMRLIHHVPFSQQEVESYRQLVFNNLTHGMKYLLDAMDDMDLVVSEESKPYVQMVEDAVDLKDGEPFPISYLEPLRLLWQDPAVQQAWGRGNEAALPDK